MKRQRRISDEAVRRATGKPWQDWFRWMDSNGASDLPHREIAALVRQQVENGWWAQSIAVEYEYARGRRTLGETDEAGFQIGVQKTLPSSRQNVWEFLTSPRGLKVWLGETKSFRLKNGARYTTEEGATGEVRTLDSGKKLRLTWHPPYLRRPSTVQIYLECPRNTPNRTTLRFHQEKLSDEHERVRMKEHWQSVLDHLAETLSE